MRPALPLLLLLPMVMSGGRWNESEPDWGAADREAAEEGGVEEGGWVLERVDAIVGGAKAVGGFLDTAIEYLGGSDGRCRYTCGNGSKPEPRPGFVAMPNGCGSPVFGLHGKVTALRGVTRCCDRHDLCYARCGASRAHCDARFRRCLGHVCERLDWIFNLFALSQGRCAPIMDAIHDGMGNLGCRPFLLSQREACVCSASPSVTSEPVAEPDYPDFLD